ncbi:hypothetical protein AMJ83_00705 [candidate division WOR_3 bacterium SM23_42]|uniref:TonB C-terminal domain-containing protein n=1 Tax=candidate division WOR_3 bacterium SM23_42 TaxID=1703779 RepID=A0A0S8FVQ6_UNCW3|nr:MAG: hypothetical protein AMJ83_00705 [candidate division WOR_3 bacterium SM23_42]
MRRFLSVFILVIIVLFSCAREEESFVGERGGTLIIGTTDLPARISPLEPSVFSSSEILDLLFLHLHRVDRKTGKMKPVLAESWEFSEDLKSVTYYLRRGVKWWDGHPVTAEDVLYTYQRMKEPSTNYPYLNSLRFIRKVEVVDPYAVRFTFEKVYADILTDSDIMALPKHIHESEDTILGENPVGNGPYRIEEWVSGSEIILTANDDYYRGRPSIDKIHIRNYKNMDDMLADFATGDLDAVLNITPQSAQELVQNENVSIYSQPGNSYLYVGWNLEHPFLQDKLVRRALSMAINNQRILTDIYAGMGEMSLGPLPSSAWGYSEAIEPIGYDADLALSVLKEQGFADFNGNGIIDKDRKDFAIRVVTNSENADRVTILRYVTEDLRRIGIRVIPQTLDAADFINALINKQFDGYIMGWRVGEKIDPAVCWKSRGTYNFVSYSNTVVDSLIDAGVSKLDRRKARETWHEFQKIIYEEQPYTFLVVPNDIAATYKRVKGVEHGVRLASANAYWIPEAERRVSVASVIPETGPKTEGSTQMPTTLDISEPTGSFVEESLAVIRPERILEAAAQSDTTVPDTTTIVAAVPPAPPKPSVITRAEPNRRIEPEYPASAAEFGASGTIVVRVLVGTDGAVKDAEVVQSFGNPACEKAALDAARQWQFDPATKDGAPFEQRVSIPFTFARQ